MLIIRRHAGETIVIGDNIEVHVVEAGPNRVKLGIIAPTDIAVLRKEVRLVRDQNACAAGAAGVKQWAAIAQSIRHVDIPTPEIDNS